MLKQMLLTSEQSSEGPVRGGIARSDESETMRPTSEQSSGGPVRGGKARSDSRSKGVKRKLNTQTLEVKYGAIMEVEKGQKSKAQIARDLQINSSTLSTWLKNAESIKEGFLNYGPSRKVMKTGRWEELDSALIKWFKNSRDQGAIISGPVLLEKAAKYADSLDISDFKGSTGWLDRFKERHGISFKAVCGESRDVQDSSSAMQEWNEKLKVILDQFSPDDIYNADETGIFFKMFPDKTMEFKNVACHGGKRSKERLTALACANMSGTDKLPLLVIGKSAKPRCFKNVKTLPTPYLANKNAWMTSEFFTNWLRDVDKKFAKERRKIAMIVDNCPAHPAVKGLKSIELLFLPPNTTSKTQPMDQGVIRNLKVHYRKRVVLRQIEAIDRKKEFSLTVLDGLLMLQEAWDCVTPVVIANCYRKAGFVSAATAVPDNTDEDDDGMDDIPLARLAMLGRANLSDFVSFDEDLQTSPSMSDDDIIAEVKEQNSQQPESDEEEIGDEEEVAPPPSHDVATDLLLDLRRYFESLDNAQPELQALCQLSRRITRERFNHKCNTRQTVLTDFMESSTSTRL